MEPEQNQLDILLVEDDPGDADLVKLALAPQSPRSRLTHAKSLAEGLAAKPHRAEFDVILLDLSLPDSFGFATVDAFRKAYPTAPIVVLTGLDDSAVEQRTVESGAQDYLIKGDFDDRGLMRAIRHAVARHNLEKRLVESEAKHRAVVSLAPDAILVVSPDLALTAANQAAANIFGTVYPDAMVGLALDSILPDAGALLERNQGLSEIRGDGIGIRGGIAFPVAMAIARLADGGFLIMATDITERARLASELRELARTDPLTGLANRRALIDAIEIEFHRGKRSGAIASLLMIDVDHFKRVNDTHGHEAGDRALISLAAVLKRMTRVTDLGARFGGEEFVLLLAETDLSGGVEMAERIRVSVMRALVVSTSGNFGLTVSIGVTTLAGNDADWSEAIRRADNALYQAKAAGRNTVASIAPNDQEMDLVVGIQADCLRV